MKRDERKTNNLPSQGAQHINSREMKDERKEKRREEKVGEGESDSEVEKKG